MKLRDAREGGWESNIYYMQTTVLMMESREKFQHTANEFKRVCHRMNLRTGVGKSKVLVVRKDQRTIGERVWWIWRKWKR